MLGSIMPTARAAQGLGLLLFLGTFLLVGGGPPPGVLPDLVKDIAAWTPTGLLIDAIRSPWAGGGLDGPAMVTLAAVAAAGFALATRRLTRS
jgi:ABC-2 type transport system permease protein